MPKCTHNSKHLVKATEVTAGPAESNGSLLPGLWRDSLHVTCGLTACTPGSAPGPALGNEYGKTLLLPFTYSTGELQLVVVNMSAVAHRRTRVQIFNSVRRFICGGKHRLT